MRFGPLITFAEIDSDFQGDRLDMMVKSNVLLPVGSRREGMFLVMEG
ncbi:hypothetical protein At15955_21350 [Agrobacterium tumefaciens]|nr:hypothetical protein X971_2608 [Agrobacterium tumefaciens LBA4213 (Ach5)]AKC08280.1 hypothetical protein Ach5_25050 [Agrobacterium tumefaciens]AYM17120.1 hypothetical protein At15955_21350 [Agrobacterium tumefaciens]AYM68420.1 hypothetical protein AtA6_22040 [Agrobacterium tumefaciens]